MRTAIFDLRRALRSLRRSRGLTAAALITLAIGLGAATAMFSVVNAVLLRPMGMTEPVRLVVMWPVVNDTAGEFTYNAHRTLARSTEALG